MPIEYDKSGFVYAISVYEFTKIGLSVEPFCRIKNIQCHIPHKINIEAIIPSENMFALEKDLHKKFFKKRKRGEWFELNCEDILYIKNLIPFGFVYKKPQKQKLTEREKQIRYYLNNRKLKESNGKNSEGFPF